ncbi:branched-chain amino acid ABC transporter permease [Shinella sp.]|uniref:branched-chain amino acid ABC transporter permease n=1 Tax=Shinella sp. TaxID=1870904 RepID=UPI0039E6CE58
MTYFLQTIVDAISLGSLYALAALGIGLLFGILRLVNFAHGDYIAIGAYALIIPSGDPIATLFIGSWPWILMIVAVIAVVVVMALCSDRLVFRHLRSDNPTSLMIASFAVGYIIQNLLLMIYGARPKSVGLWSGLTEIVTIAGLRIPMLQLVIIGVSFLLLVALVAFMRFTRFGLQMRAAAEDFRMARYLGVRADFVIGLAFAISGMLAAVVSLLFLAQTGTLAPTMGAGLVLYAFVATVLGGMGSLAGAVLGGYMIGLLITLLQTYLPPDLRPFRDAFMFAALILILLVRPSGIIRVKALEERV